MGKMMELMPFKEANDYLAHKIALPTSRYDDLTKEEQQMAFTIAGITNLEILQFVQDAVKKAVNEGTTLDVFKKKIGSALATFTEKRLKLIYQTNINVAYGNGRYEQQRKIQSERPYWLYRHGGSKHPRKHHLALDGKVFMADDPIWERIYPPNGFGCSCKVFALSERDMQRSGLTVSESREMRKVVGEGESMIGGNKTPIDAQIEIINRQLEKYKGGDSEIFKALDVMRIRLLVLKKDEGWQILSVDEKAKEYKNHVLELHKLLFQKGKSNLVYDSYFDNNDIRIKPLKEAFGFVNRLLGKKYLADKPHLIIDHDPLINQYSAEFQKIFLTPKVSISTIIHEIAHHIEQDNPHIIKTLGDFWKWRTRNDPDKLVRDLVGDRSISESAIYREDEFIGLYWGRIYQNRNGAIEGTELLSHALEMLYRNPVAFAKRDPQLFELALRLFR